MVSLAENPTNFKPLLARVFPVCDEHREFKDMKLFYRFRKDDGTFPLDSEAKVFMRGQRIYEKYERTNAPQNTDNQSDEFVRDELRDRAANS